MDKLLLRPVEVAELLSISRTKAYELIAAGVLPSVRVGASVRVPAGQLRAWIEKHTSVDTARDDESVGPNKTRESVGTPEELGRRGRMTRSRGAGSVP